MQRNFAGIEDTSAYKAIADIRAQLDELNPGNDGDLMQPRKLLGLIPFGNKLEAYFRKYQSASEQLKTSMSQLYEARDDMQKDVIDIEATRGKLWDAIAELVRDAGYATAHFGKWHVGRERPQQHGFDDDLGQVDEVIPAPDVAQFMGDDQFHRLGEIHLQRLWNPPSCFGLEKLPAAGGIDVAIAKASHFGTAFVQATTGT